MISSPPPAAASADDPNRTPTLADVGLTEATFKRLAAAKQQLSGCYSLDMPPPPSLSDVK